MSRLEKYGMKQSIEQIREAGRTPNYQDYGRLSFAERFEAAYRSKKIANFVYTD